VEGRAGVWIMAATNRPDILDPAVLRPGRLDKILYVGFPGPRDRVEILRALTKNGTKPMLGSGVSLTMVGEDSRCEGFSGADVGNLVREASMNALRESLKRGRNEGPVMVEKEHFEKAFRVLKPSVGVKDRARYETMGKRYGEREPVDDNVQGLHTGQGVGNEILSDNEVEMIEPQISDAESNLIPVGGSLQSDVVFNAAIQGENANDSISTQIVTGESTKINDVTDPDSNKDREDRDEDILETFVSKDDIIDLEASTEKSSFPISSETTAKHLSDDKTPNTTALATPKISIRSPDNLNGEVSKFYSSIAAIVPQPLETKNPGVELRFLPDMVIRVVDNSTVKEIGGKNGKIVSVRGGGERATVKLEGLSGARIVSVKEVEVELPEEGDKVKSLVWGSPPEVGEVISLDDDDNAVVKFGDEQMTIQIDMLCKVEVG